MTEFINEYLIPYWHLLAAATALGIFGEFFKKYVFTRESTSNSKLIAWGRRTLPLHPVIAGGLLGLVPGMPAPETVTTTAGLVLYYAGSGLLSTWVYSLYTKYMQPNKDAPE